MYMNSIYKHYNIYTEYNKYIFWLWRPDCQHPHITGWFWAGLQNKPLSLQVKMSILSRNVPLRSTADQATSTCESRSASPSSLLACVHCWPVEDKGQWQGSPGWGSSVLAGPWSHPIYSSREKRHGIQYNIASSWLSSTNILTTRKDMLHVTAL